MLDSLTRNPGNDLQYAWLLLATRSTNSLRCALMLLESGYYSQSLTLVRSAMEDNLTALDCEGHEPTLKALLEGEGDLGKGDLTFTRMAQRVSDKFAEDWKYNYGKLSEYAAHARHISVTHLVDSEKALRLAGVLRQRCVSGNCRRSFVWLHNNCTPHGKNVGPKCTQLARKSLPGVQHGASMAGTN